VARLEPALGGLFQDAVVAARFLLDLERDETFRFCCHFEQQRRKFSD
jgi:hypothetical protein